MCNDSRSISSSTKSLCIHLMNIKSHILGHRVLSNACIISNRKAFQHFYKQNVEFSCPTEDIFLE